MAKLGVSKTRSRHRIALLDSPLKLYPRLDLCYSLFAHRTIFGKEFSIVLCPEMIYPTFYLYLYIDICKDSSDKLIFLT